MRFVRSQVLSLRAVWDSATEDSTNKKKSGLARFKRWVIKSNCCVGMGDSERKFEECECARIRLCPSGGSGSIGLISDYEGPCPVSRSVTVRPSHLFEVGQALLVRWESFGNVYQFHAWCLAVSNFNLFSSSSSHMACALRTSLSVVGNSSCHCRRICNSRQTSCGTVNSMGKSYTSRIYVKCVVISAPPEETSSLFRPTTRLLVPEILRGPQAAQGT